MSSLLFVRIACIECGVERVIREEPDEEHGTVWAWPPCPDHPDADSRQLCFCGEDETGCAILECTETASVHIAGPMQDTFYGAGLCDVHDEIIRANPDGDYNFARHRYNLESMDDVMEVAGLPGVG